MNFTAQEARDILSEEGYLSQGQVIDLIKEEARDGRTEIIRSQHKPITQYVLDNLSKNGFKVNKNKISWKSSLKIV